jgi:FAD/FMN-containing dehydrogenase
MNDSPPPSREIEATAAMPLSKVDETLLESFAQDVAAQAARLDDLAKQIITLSLAVPGIYAAVLKLVSGDKATLDNPWLLLIAFSAWMLALGLALSSLLPVKREVDQDSLSDIQRYFSDSARHKWWLLAPACVSSFFGICFAVLGIFI